MSQLAFCLGLRHAKQREGSCFGLQVASRGLGTITKLRVQGNSIIPSQFRPGICAGYGVAPETRPIGHHAENVICDLTKSSILVEYGT
jgi:hypothetical protein